MDFGHFISLDRMNLSLTHIRKHSTQCKVANFCQGLSYHALNGFDLHFLCISFEQL